MAGIYNHKPENESATLDEIYLHEIGAIHLKRL